MIILLFETNYSVCNQTANEINNDSIEDLKNERIQDIIW